MKLRLVLSYARLRTLHRHHAPFHVGKLEVLRILRRLLLSFLLCGILLTFNVQIFSVLRVRPLKGGIIIAFRRSNVVRTAAGEWLQARLVQLATIPLPLRLIIALRRCHIAQKAVFCDLVRAETHFVLLLLLIVLLH